MVPAMTTSPDARPLVSDEAVRAYKTAFGEYLDKCTRAEIEPPSPDIGFHACAHGLTAALPHMGGSAEPELLAAAKAAVEYYDKLNRPHDDGEPLILDNLAAAITKAARIRSALVASPAPAVAEAEIARLKQAVAEERAPRGDGLKRTFEQWEKMDPAAVAEGSKAQVFYALKDAKSDIAEFKRVLQVLADPVAVHGNMLRGTIAKPSFENMLHLYPEEAAELKAAEREACAKVAETLGPWRYPDNVGFVMIDASPKQIAAAIRARSEEATDAR